LENGRSPCGDPSGDHVQLRTRCLLAKEEHHMPGRHINDHQVRLYIKFRRTDSPEVASAKAGFSTASVSDCSTAFDRLHSCGSSHPTSRVELGPQVDLKRRDAPLVHVRRTLVGRHTLPGILDQSLGDLERSCLRSRVIRLR